ncbi:MAG: hypothetical protein IJN01_06030 [Rikenellaceae bacterium]|nr:hypothetical protein [Rikenellaceae bacterium]
MKALKYFASALALVALFTACEEESEYQPAQLPETQEAYFPATTMTVSMEELTNGFEVELARVNYDEAATATLKSERPEGVNVPSTVSFNAGQEKTTFTVSVDQAALGQGKTFKIVMNVDSESNSPYANQRCTVTLTTWSPEPPVTWEPIETEAMFRQNLFTVFGTAEQTYDVYVEKRADCEMYRIANAFTYYEKGDKAYHFPYYATGDEVAPLEPVTWTIVDCSGKLAAEEGLTLAKNAVWMPIQTTNNDWGYGEMLFGSFAYNLSTSAGLLTPADYPIGIYDPATKSIALGNLALYLPTNGWYAVYSSPDPKSWATLYLDKNLMGTDFERDCEFTKLQDATLISQIAGGKWQVALHEGVPTDEKKAEEYEETFGQVIKVENAYTDGFDIYFCVDAEGKVSVPADYEFQAMGQSMSGFDLYLNIKKGTFENNMYTLECVMIGKDPAKVKADVNFAEYTEVISVESVIAAESIDDFCGEWNFSGIDYKEPETSFSYVATIEKISETQAALKYLLDPSGELNDAIIMDYVDGELYLAPQNLGVTTPTGYDVVVNTIGFYDGEGPYFFEPATEDYPFAPGMVLQLTDAGNIKIVDDPVNAQYGAEIVAFYYAAYQEGEHLGYFTEYYSSVEMTPAASTATAAAKALSVTISKDSKFTGKLTKSEIDRRAKVGDQRAEVKTKATVRQLVGQPRTEFVTL